VTFVENSEYHKSNGISALQAKDKIHENFLLLMADHIFEPETAQALLERRLQPGEVILAVDPTSIASLTSTTQPRFAATGTVLWISARKSLATTRSIPGCFCAARPFWQARSGHKGWRLFALRWHAATGQPAPPACHGNRRGSMARRGYPQALAYAEGVFDGFIHTNGM